MYQQSQIIPVKPLAVVSVERCGLDRRAPSRRDWPSTAQHSKSGSSSPATKNSTSISFGLAVLWIILAINASGIYFLTRVDLPTYQSPTSIKDDNITTKAKASPPNNLSSSSSGGSKIDNVSELTFFMKDGSYRKTKFDGKRLGHGGGGGIIIDAVSGTGRNKPTSIR
jgi:hypothetical protein